jgi:hypothetical protein
MIESAPMKEITPEQRWANCIASMPLEKRLINAGECSIIGGTVDERLAYATKLRRIGFATWFEYRETKRSFKRACEANYWGKNGVYNLDDAEDRAWLDRDDLATKGV